MQIFTLTRFCFASLLQSKSFVSLLTNFLANRRVYKYKSTICKKICMSFALVSPFGQTFTYKAKLCKKVTKFFLGGVTCTYKSSICKCKGVACTNLWRSKPFTNLRFVSPFGLRFGDYSEGMGRDRGDLNPQFLP